MKIGKLTVSTFAAALCMVSAAESLPAEPKNSEPVFNSPVYQCKVFNRYLKNNGLINLTLGGKNLIAGSLICATLKDADGKNIVIREKADPNYEWKNDVLTSRKTMVSRDAKAEPFAEVNRKIQFSGNKISSEIVIKSLRDITFAQTWTCYREIILFTTKSLSGMRLDGIQMDGQTLSTAVPRKFDKKKWIFSTKRIKKLTLTGQDETTITVTAAPNCKMHLNHYGGKQVELYVWPVGKYFGNLKQKVGQETKIGYTIEFGKVE